MYPLYRRIRAMLDHFIEIENLSFSHKWIFGSLKTEKLYSKLKLSISLLFFTASCNVVYLCNIRYIRRRKKNGLYVLPSWFDHLNTSLLGVITSWCLQVATVSRTSFKKHWFKQRKRKIHRAGEKKLLFYLCFSAKSKEKCLSSCCCCCCSYNSYNIIYKWKIIHKSLCIHSIFYCLSFFRSFTRCVYNKPPYFYSSTSFYTHCVELLNTIIRFPWRTYDNISKNRDILYSLALPINSFR